MEKRKRMTADQKTRFIIETEMAILKAVHAGHKCSDEDEFAEARKLVGKYRKELGLAPNKKKK